MKTQPSVPLCVYVCWHHDSPDGRTLAHVAYDWLRGLYVDRGRGQIDLHRFGLGVPVYYRTSVAEPAASSPRNKAHLSIADIDQEGATTNVLVLLVDHHMVNDPAWRRWVFEQTDPARTTNTLVLPVALHDSAFALGRALGQRNFLRLPDVARSSRVDRREGLLQRRLTEVCLRALANDGKDDRTPQQPAGSETVRPLKVFISHAKGDGRDIGARFRDAIYRYGQITAFFDENDLPLGHRYDTRLDDNIQDCDAMLCIQSDLYSSRPWCRREADLARTPRLNQDEVWLTVPTLVVDQLDQHPTQMIPELGYTTAVRWRDRDEDHVLDLLMRETLSATYHRRLAGMLRQRLMEVAKDEVGTTAFLSWVPDMYTVRKVREKTSAPRLVYPGHGLAGSQLDNLQAFSGVSELWTYEDLADHLAHLGTRRRAGPTPTQRKDA